MTTKAPSSENRAGRHHEASKVWPGRSLVRHTCCDDGLDKHIPHHPRL